MRRGRIVAGTSSNPRATKMPQGILTEQVTTNIGQQKAHSPNDLHRRTTTRNEGFSTQSCPLGPPFWEHPLKDAPFTLVYFWRYTGVSCGGVFHYMGVFQPFAFVEWLGSAERDGAGVGCVGISVERAFWEVVLFCTGPCW